MDPDEGNRLKFVQLHEINGTKCVKLEKEDTASEIVQWTNVVICGVIVANPPLEVIEGFIYRIWGHLCIDKVVMVRKGIFLTRFTNQEDKLTVLKRVMYFFDKKPFLVKEWNAEQTLDIASLHTLPIWVQLPDIDLKYSRMECLSKLGNALGIPIKADRIIKEKTVLRYARILVEMEIDLSLIHI